MILAIALTLTQDFDVPALTFRVTVYGQVNHLGI